MSLAIFLLLSLFITFHGEVESSPPHPLPFRQKQFLFKDRCNVYASKKLCPNLQDSCCCRDKQALENFFKPTSSGVFEDTELITLCTALSRSPSKLPSQTRELVLFNSNIVSLTSSSLNKSHLSHITFFEISDDKALSRIESDTFADLLHLRQIYMENVENLVYIAESAFSNLPKLRTLTLKETGLKQIQGFRNLGNPHGTHLTISLLENKWLTRIQQHAFSNLNSRVVKIAIKRNAALSIVEDFAFNGSSVRHLILSDNPTLTDFSSMAFAGIHHLTELAFDNTPIKSLPADGLAYLTTLHAHNVPNMIRFPKLHNLQHAELTYPYHCCALLDDYGFGTLFENDKKDERIMVRCDTGEELPTSGGEGEWSTDHSNDFIDEEDSWHQFHPHSFNSGSANETAVKTVDNNTEYLEYLETYSGNYEYDYFFMADLRNSWKTLTNEEELHEEYPSDTKTTDSIHLEKPTTTSSIALSAKVIPVCYKDANGEIRKFLHESKMQCSPMADKFNPCEDLLGSNAISILSWFVAWLAVLGNFFVVFALLLVAFDHRRTHQRHLTVSKFLILNLAFADFCMGIYILALAVMDNKSKGSYYKFGVEWQTQGGCDIVGFLSVFASQLSVYTLSVISLERWYAIRYAIQLDKRMTLKCGQVVMSIGWIISIILAILPLAGVNSYQKTAICLPMDVENFSGKAYVAVLLSLDIIAFFMVSGSYLWMYAIVKTTKNGQKTICELFQVRQKYSRDDCRTRSNKGDGCYGAMDKQTADTRIAKRMAVLVFTDFACFFPISFFSLFAMAGYPLLSISTAKFLLVLCYPLNACTNPFLYSIMTKSFKKDVRFVMKSLKRLFCIHGDDRQRMSTNRKKQKHSEMGDRQQERRKTLHVCIDAEPENLQVDGYTSVEQKSVSTNTKTTYLKMNTSSSAANSRCNSVSSKPKIVKNDRKKWMKKRKVYSRVINNSVSSTVSADDNLRERSTFFLILTSVLSIFKRNKTSTRTRRLGSVQQSFETHVTAATAASNLCDVRADNEQYEMKQVLCDKPKITQGDNSYIRIPVISEARESLL